MNNIIEYIGKKGVKSTHHNLFNVRCSKPKSGDIIDFGEFTGKYPFNNRFGRISDVEASWADKGEIHVCCHMGSAFLCDNGNVSISGGPFTIIKLDEIEPQYYTKMAEYWNWGDNSAGANNGVHYNFERPVFKLIKYSDKAYN